jgi:hypothetical protein
MYCRMESVYGSIGNVYSSMETVCNGKGERVLYIEWRLLLVEWRLGTLVWRPCAEILGSRKPQRSSTHYIGSFFKSRHANIDFL